MAAPGSAPRSRRCIDRPCGRSKSSSWMTARPTRRAPWRSGVARAASWTWSSAMARAAAAVRQSHHEADSQGVAIPACALAQKADGACRPGRFGPGVRHETDEMAEAPQPQAELQVLSGADVEAALPHEYLAPVHGAGAGETSDGAHDVQYGSPCADRHQVLDTLQSGPQRFALVADRNVATRAGDVRIAENGREPRDGGRLENRVGVHGQEQVPAGKPRGSVDCRTAAAARAMADDHVHQAARAGPLRHGPRPVRRAVIHDDDFERSQGLSMQRRDRGAKPGAAVESRYDHADRSLARTYSIVSPPRSEERQR